MTGKASYLLFLLMIVVFLSFSLVRARPDGLMHVVFCNVGQGDAIYLKLPDGKDILVDGGPNNDVLNCIGKHMAFWDRTIELVVLTHPQHDHFRGLTDVIDRYDVKMLFTPPVGNKAASYKNFTDAILDEHVPYRNVYADDMVLLTPQLPNDRVVMNILSPAYDWTEGKIDSSNPDSSLIDKKVLAATTRYSDLNDFSIVLTVSYKQFDVLLTGDAEYQILEDIINRDKLNQNTIELYKIGHHGARAGLSEFIAHFIQPDLAVISAGKNNRYGHPRSEVLDMLADEQIPVKRTDIDGEVHVVSDGERWWFQ